MPTDLPAAHNANAESELKILYQDESVVAVHKPGGLLVHRSMIDRRETRFLLQLLRDQIGQRVYPLHRLDKPTQGIVLMALSPEIARLMGPQFEQGDVKKHYWAIVRGYCEAQNTIDYALKEELDAMTDGKAKQDKPAQAAVTQYRRLARVEWPYPVGRYDSARYSLLELQPKTGRKHQLRRHLKHIFHPIVGDTTHGDGKQNRFFRDHFHAHGLMLCAKRLSFVHPINGDRIQLETRLDAEMQRLVDDESWRWD